MTPGIALPLPDELVDVLRGTATCYLSTVMPDGSPQMTQTWVDTDGRDVLINTVVGHQKVKNIQRDPRVALALSSTKNPSRYFEVRGHHRSGLIACVYRAAEWRHKDVELAAHDLLQHLDTISA